MLQLERVGSMAPLAVREHVQLQLERALRRALALLEERLRDSPLVRQLREELAMVVIGRTH